VTWKQFEAKPYIPKPNLTYSIDVDYFLCDISEYLIICFTRVVTSSVFQQTGQRLVTCICRYSGKCLL